MNEGYNKIKDQPRNKGMFVPLGNEPMGTMTLRLPISVIKQIEEEAKKNGISKTELARKIVQEQFS